MSPDAWVAGAVTLFVALLAYGGGWATRRSSKPLNDAQADKAEAETLQIVDEIARVWIEELRHKVAAQEEQILALSAELAAQRRDVHVLVKHIGVLEHHINDRKPPPPPPMPALRA